MSTQDEINRLTKKQEQIKKMAVHMVDDLGMMGGDAEGHRLSGGHKWGRSHSEDQRLFFDVAEQILDGTITFPQAQARVQAHYQRNSDILNGRDW